MGLYLVSKNPKEICMTNRNLILSSLGRIYTTVDHIDNISFTYNYSEFIININNRNPIFSKQISGINNYGNKYGEIHYEYNNISVDTTTLIDYLKLSNSFMAFLIDRNINAPFETIIQDYNPTMSINDIHSLLKPVYIRYMKAKRNPQNLINIRNNINNPSNIRNIKKITLYDVPCIIENSRLRLLDNLWIDLTELVDVQISDPPYIRYVKFKCISLGRINKFDKIEIQLFKETDLKSINFYNGISIKKIILMGKGYY